MLGFGDKATELYRMINPIEHSRTKEASQKYKVEPYVIPADIYGSGNLAGRGGWTWYTGSAGWFYRVGIEEILGVKKHGNFITIEPNLPNTMKEFRLVYKYQKATYNIEVAIGNKDQVIIDGKIKKDGMIPLVNKDKIYTVQVIRKEGNENVKI